MHPPLNSKEAHDRIRAHILRTPVTLSHSLCQLLQGNVYFKNEHLQHTGSFKLRGALNKILSLSPSQAKKGVLAASTGNHGLAVSYAAKVLNTTATIYISNKASAMKKKGIIDFGGKVIEVEGDCLTAELMAREQAEKNGQIFISPYNDRDVIAGQGTIGVELLEQIPSLDAVFISVGGGGLLSGIASYLKAQNPKIKIVGCWAKNSPVMFECMKVNMIRTVPEETTVADALAGNIEPGTVTLPLCRKYIDDCVLVTEEEIYEAIKFAAETERWMIEGGAAVAIASVRQKAEAYQSKNVAAIICGRNISLQDFQKALECVS